MNLSDHRKHKIYIAAKMGLNLGSEDPTEINFYNLVKSEMIKDSKFRYLGILEKINLTNA